MPLPVLSLRRLPLVCSLGVVSFLGACHFRSHGSSSWHALSPGLSTRSFQATGARIIAFRAPAKAFRVVGGDYLPASEWLRKTRARVVVNAGYFDGRGRPMGLRRGKNTPSSRLRGADWGVFWVKDGVAHLSHTRDFSPSLRPDEAVQCGPRLVVNGEVTKLKPQFARRTGVGVDRQGRVVLAVADGELSLDEWARAWASPSGLNCRDALNMDGGPSTQLAVRGRTELNIQGGWPVPDALAFK